VLVLGLGLAAALRRLVVTAAEHICGTTSSLVHRRHWDILVLMLPGRRITYQTAKVKVKSQKSKSKSNPIHLAEPESNVKWN
jgi:hypothetical protein